jgi:hypothetical protein
MEKEVGDGKTYTRRGSGIDGEQRKLLTKLFLVTKPTPEGPTPFRLERKEKSNAQKQ